MKNRLLSLLLIFLLVPAIGFSATHKPASCLTGGTTGCLDAIDGSTISAGDHAKAQASGIVYYYTASTNGAGESSPDIIVPDTNPGNINWDLDGVYAATLQSVSGTSIDEFSTDGTLAGNSDNAAPTEKAVKTYADTAIAASAAALVPPGAILAFAQASCPSGWLENDGSAVNRTTYADLFTNIAETYGVGNGSTTFNLPDTRGYFLRGWDHGAGNDPDAAGRTDRGDGTTGDNVGTKQADAFKDHTHVGTQRSDQTSTAGGEQYDVTAGQVTGNSSTGGNETRPLNVNVLYCIKY